MNKSQYNNIINCTVKQKNAEDSVNTARAIFNNMGVALPQGNFEEIAETLKRDDYMGWKSCTREEAQEAANRGIATIAVGDNEIVVVAADGDESIVESHAVATLSNTTSSTSTMRYYSYINDTTDLPPETLYFTIASMNQTVGWSGYVPFEGYIYSPISWSSSNTQVAMVDNTGEIQAVGVGEATITVRTDSGKSDSFIISVQPYMGYASEEKTLFGSAIGDIVAAQSYRVKINLWYNITKKSNGRVFVTSVNSYASYDKGNIMVGLEYPHLEIGVLTIGENTYRMDQPTNPAYVPTNCVYDRKEKVLNQWFDEGEEITNLAILMLDGSLFAYREVKVKTTLNTD